MSERHFGIIVRDPSDPRIVAGRVAEKAIVAGLLAGDYRSLVLPSGAVEPAQPQADKNLPKV